MDLTKYLVNPADKDDDGYDFLLTATSIETQERLGRVVVSNVNVDELCARVIREKPLLVWGTSCWSNYLDAFLALDDEDKAIVLDMFCPSVPSDKDKLAAKMIDQKFHFCSRITSETIHRLISIANFNSHEYYGSQSSNEYSVREMPMPNMISSGRSALFAFGSKVAHSCEPNVAYSSKTNDGCLEYKVIRKIATGDQITFSYLGKLFATPTHVRRKTLQETKDFFCQCSRCIAPDYCRFHTCPKTSGCKEYVTCTRGGTDTLAKWTCPSCGPLEDIFVQELATREEHIRVELDQLQMSLMFSLTNVLPKDYTTVLQSASTSLSGCHYLTLRALEDKARLCASHANGLERFVAMGMSRNSRTPFGSLTQLCLEAGTAGLQWVSRCECIAASCSGLECKDGSCVHEPVYECATELFHAFQDMKRVPFHLWPSFAAAMFHRYIPLLYVAFGEGDSDTKEIEDTLSTIPVHHREEDKRPTMKQASPSHPRNHGRNKKRGNLTNKKKKNRR